MSDLELAYRAGFTKGSAASLTQTETAREMARLNVENSELREVLKNILNYQLQPQDLERLPKECKLYKIRQNVYESALREAVAKARKLLRVGE